MLRSIGPFTLAGGLQLPRKHLAALKQGGPPPSRHRTPSRLLEPRMESQWGVEQGRGAGTRRRRRAWAASLGPARHSPALAPGSVPPCVRAR